ncbi:MAG: toxin-antitoxin system YwqK family antitoxin [Cytophagales bacterium]
MTLKKNFNTCLFLFFLIFKNWVFSQSPGKRTLFFDKEQNHIKEKSEFYIKNEKRVLHGSFESYYENGNLKSKGFYHHNKPTGKWKYFFENGKLQMEGSYSDGVPVNEWNYYYESGNIAQIGKLSFGKKNGSWINYFENGKNKSIGYYKNDIPEGVWHFYHEDGSIKARAVYEDGFAEYTEFFPDQSTKAKGFLKNGISDSLWVYFHPNGKIKATGLEKNGMREGLWYFYHENGNLAAKGGYELGKSKGMWSYYHENGQLSGEGIENDGEKDGYWKLYYDTGAFKGEGKFISGSGDYKEYYESGKLKIEGKILKGKNNGLWKYYYESGEEEGNCEFIDGEGDYIGFYPNGNLKMEGKIANGEKTGTWKLYNELGNLVGFYKNYNDPIFKRYTENNRAKKDTIDFEKLENPDWKKKDLGKKQTLFDNFIHFKKNNQLLIIPSFNPLGLIINQMPIYLEFLQKKKRLGVEFIYTMYRNPFFESHQHNVFNKTFTQGHFLGLKYKRYTKTNDNKGLRYFAGELRYKSISNFHNAQDSSFVDLGLPFEKKIRVNEQAFELAALFGDRFMKNYNKSSVTADFFIGIGIGYRVLNENFDGQVVYQRRLENISYSDWYVPIRVGISLGYAF